MNIFDKKFKTRGVHYSKAYNKVEYANYRFIPDWQTLCFWYQGSFSDDTECWSTKLMSLEAAEDLANQLKSIEDIKEWYKPHEKRREFFIRKKKILLIIRLNFFLYYMFIKLIIFFSLLLPIPLLHNRYDVIGK